MRIIYKVKNVLGMSRPVVAGGQQHQADNLRTTSKSSSRSNSIHSVPPGEWPKEGPKPSKCAVLFFYISITLTVIGTIIVIRSAFFLQVSRIWISVPYLSRILPFDMISQKTH